MDKRVKNNLNIIDFQNEDYQEQQKKPQRVDVGSGLTMTTQPTKKEQMQFQNPRIVQSHNIHKKIPNFRRERNYRFQGWDIIQCPSEMESDGNKNRIRVQQHFCIYILTLVSTLLTGMQNIYVFIMREDTIQLFIFLPSVTFRIIFSIATSYCLCKDRNVLVKLYLTVDKLFVTEIIETVAVFAYVSIYMPYSQYPWFYRFYQIIYPVMIFSTTGYLRVILIYSDWKPIQVIAYKICLMIGAISFFTIGIFYTVTSAQFTNGRSPQVDFKIKEIIFLFIFAGFTYFSEMFDKMDNVDGTANFKAGYKLECNPEDMEILLGNKKVSNSS